MDQSYFCISFYLSGRSEIDGCGYDIKALIDVDVVNKGKV